MLICLQKLPIKLIRRSLSPVDADGGCGMVTSNSCNLAMGWFVCFAGGNRLISISAAASRLVGTSGLSPVDSMMVSDKISILRYLKDEVDTMYRCKLPSMDKLENTGKHE